ncbi:hypothetical protein Flavo103_21240 [Flavobacterium collinsii]|uniref:TIR domain-containing protein n=1 Tax=Flavobacterium collinsii TaxID=1114861 RepID=UPI0022C6728A|nr:TIR domain-containing protein [Flavobacterium collinsii]GIQ58988.1 hypothetical protein Flavo103_21240 [Flavobacterium collinsii]
MGKKIFVSYKYSDNQVENLSDLPFGTITTARNYVDLIQEKLDNETDHIYKGENDDESLESLADSTISSKLGDKIFDSTVTIVLISKGMNENTKDADQWMPWEISYSLNVQSREGRSSKTNAILGVVLPDNNGSYNYYYRYNPLCNSITHFTNQLFDILKENMFNLKNPETRSCNGSTIHEGESSFIKTIEWNKFIENIDFYVNKALEICENKSNYTIRKKV